MEAGAAGKEELVDRILARQSELAGHAYATGILDVVDEGFGFMRRHGLMPSQDDVYVSSSQIRRFGLRVGDRISGSVRAPREGEKYWGMIRVDRVNGIDPETAKRRPQFADLTPVHPDVLINLETDPKNLSQRLINLVNPIGKGQRALIVSPPKAGKTMLLKQIANGISTNYPDILLMVALIGERPEEVTDMRRSVKGEVISSTFDEPTENHTHVAEMALEIAKRQVETGRDVVILLDSITRLARAYNLALPPSGRTLSGGLDPIALYPPKRFFGAARNIEEGGSLTIIGTCLVDTGSRMDDVIYEEFKGTGNSELILDRKLAEKRIFPAIDVQRSGTRREELLLEEPVLKMVWTMRRMLSAVGTNEGIELLLNRLVQDGQQRPVPGHADQEPRRQLTGHRGARGNGTPGPVIGPLGGVGGRPSDCRVQPPLIRLARVDVPSRAAGVLFAVIAEPRAPRPPQAWSPAIPRLRSTCRVGSRPRLDSSACCTWHSAGRRLGGRTPRRRGSPATSVAPETRSPDAGPRVAVAVAGAAARAGRLGALDRSWPAWDGTAARSRWPPALSWWPWPQWGRCRRFGRGRPGTQLPRHRPPPITISTVVDPAANSSPGEPGRRRRPGRRLGLQRHAGGRAAPRLQRLPDLRGQGGDNLSKIAASSGSAATTSTGPTPAACPTRPRSRSA